MKFKLVVILALLIISAGMHLNCNSGSESGSQEPAYDTSSGADPNKTSNGTTSTRPANGSVACDEIVWVNDWDKAIKKAQNENKPILINFYTDVCPACDMLDKNTLSNKEVASSICRNFVTVKSNAGKSNLYTNYGISSVPTTVFARPDGKELGRIVGAYPPKSFLDGISQAIEYWGQHK
ncbi:MAG: thioredoxin family protein [Dehalococcoidia bacterium]